MSTALPLALQLRQHARPAIRGASYTAPLPLRFLYSFIAEQDAQLKTEYQRTQKQAHEIAYLKQQAQKVASLEQQVTALKAQAQNIEGLTAAGMVEKTVVQLGRNPS
jgi:hypothetical protein